MPAPVLRFPLHSLVFLPYNKKHLPGRRSSHRNSHRICKQYYLNIYLFQMPPFSADSGLKFRSSGILQSYKCSFQCLCAYIHCPRWLRYCSPGSTRLHRYPSPEMPGFHQWTSLRSYLPWNPLVLMLLAPGLRSPGFLFHPAVYICLTSYQLPLPGHLPSRSECHHLTAPDICHQQYPGLA